MSIADRVRKLAALAGSANEHEANAAARQACRLIRDGKVSIVDAASERPHAAREHPYRAERPRSSWDPWADAPSPPPRRRAPIRGPFTRRRDVQGQSCVACGERIELGDAFSCADGHIHGDCIPVAERS